MKNRIYEHKWDEPGSTDRESTALSGKPLDSKLFPDIYI